MDNVVNNNNEQFNVAGRPTATPNGQAGTWVPVDASTLPFTVGGEANTPMQGPDGNIYCIGSSAPQYGQIAANQYNAIPTPSSTVQLPPIVQPIALVPYASQNQPLVQYNPNYRPQEQPLPSDPVYRAKPYSALSVLLVLIAVAAGVVIGLIKAFSVGGANVTGIDTVFGLLKVFGVDAGSSVYYDKVLGTVFKDGFAAGFKDVKVGLCLFLIPLFYAVNLVFALVLVIKYLVKLGKKSSPRCFSVIALLGLIFGIVNLVIVFLSEKLTGYDMTCELGMYIFVALYAVLLILPAFARKGAMVIDYEASKRVYYHQ